MNEGSILGIGILEGDLGLMLGGIRGWFYYSPTSDDHFQPVMNEHFLYIQQMGLEILNSPELLALSA